MFPLTIFCFNSSSAAFKHHCPHFPLEHIPSSRLLKFLSSLLSIRAALRPFRISVSQLIMFRKKYHYLLVFSFQDTLNALRPHFRCLGFKSLDKAAVYQLILIETRSHTLSLTNILCLSVILLKYPVRQHEREATIEQCACVSHTTIDLSRSITNVPNVLFFLLVYSRCLEGILSGSLNSVLFAFSRFSSAVHPWWLWACCLSVLYVSRSQDPAVYLVFSHESETGGCYGVVRLKSSTEKRKLQKHQPRWLFFFLFYFGLLSHLWNGSGQVRSMLLLCVCGAARDIFNDPKSSLVKCHTTTVFFSFSLCLPLSRATRFKALLCLVPSTSLLLLPTWRPSSCDFFYKN